MLDEGDPTSDALGLIPRPHMDQQELVVHVWLEAISPDLADAYVTMLGILEGREFPAWRNLVCYLARDIMNNPFAAATGEDGHFAASGPYRDAVSAVKSSWPQLEEVIRSAQPGGSSVHVPPKAVRPLKRLDGVHTRATTEPPGMEKLAGWLHDPFGPTEAGRLEHFARNLKNLQRWFSELGHTYASEAPPPTKAEVRDRVSQLTSLLFPIVERRDRLLPRLRRVLESANSIPYEPPCESDAIWLASMVVAPDVHRYAFEALHNPHWLEPLDERGAFAIPDWVCAGYLVRVAADEPRRVATILKGWTTNHQGVVGQMFEAALAMPAEHAAEISDHLSDELIKNHFDWLLEDAGKLVKHLLLGGQDERACAMLRRVWSRAWVAEDPNRAHETMYYYTTSMREHVIPVFLEHDPRFLLDRLCEFLDQERDAHGLRDRDDPSAIDVVRERGWERPEYHAYEAFQDLVDLLVEAANQAVRQQEITLADVIGLLRKHARGLRGRGAILYERLGIWLAANNGASDPNLAAAFVKHPRYLVRAAYLPEYGLLVEMRFYLLSEAERTRWIRRVVAGPRRLSARLDTDEWREWARAHWTLERLYFARQYLDEGTKEFYEALQREHEIDPSPQPIDFEGQDLHVWGPYTGEQLTEMGWPAAVHATRDWQPDESADIFNDPSYDGLDEAFQAFVQADAQKAATHAEDLVGAPPWMLAAYFAALQDARRTGVSIDLVGPLKLAAHAAERAAEHVSPESVRTSREPNSWEWVARATGWFVERVPRCKVGEHVEELGFEHRDVLWRAIEALARVRAVSRPVEYSATVDRRRSDYLTLMFNDAAGIALRAARAYAEWAMPGLGVDLAKGPAPSEGLDALPEVRALLTERLDSEPREPVAHAAIGEAVRLLAWLDPGWTKANAPRIFPLAGEIESDSDAAGWAAWSVFVFMNRGDPVFWSLFEDTYRTAMQVAVTFEEPARGREEWAPRLGLHLIDLVGSGTIGLDDDSPALAFLRKARPWLRIAVMGHLAEMIGHTREPIRPAHLARYQALWEAYWSKHGKADSREADSSALFGRWFVSDQSDPLWALEQLRSLVEAGVYPRPDRKIAAKLDRLADESAEIVTRIALATVRNTSHAYEILGWREHAERIVRKGLAGDDAEKVAANELRELLIKRGFGGWFNLGSDDSPPA